MPIWIRRNGGEWNGSPSANPVTSTGGYGLTGLSDASMIPFGVCNNNGLLFNFGSTSFSYGVPSGFVAGWPNASNSGFTELDASTSQTGGIITNSPTNTSMGSGSSQGFVAATFADAKTVGSYYFEVTILSTTIFSANIGFGVCIPGADISHIQSGAYNISNPDGGVFAGSGSFILSQPLNVYISSSDVSGSLDVLANGDVLSLAITFEGGTLPSTFGTGEVGTVFHVPATVGVFGTGEIGFPVIEALPLLSFTNLLGTQFSTSGISVGEVISGENIPDNAIITSIVGDVVTFTQLTTGTIDAGQSVRISSYPGIEINPSIVENNPGNLAGLLVTTGRRRTNALLDPYFSENHPEERLLFTADDGLQIFVMSDADIGGPPQVIKEFNVSSYGTSTATLFFDLIAQSASGIMVFLDGVRTTDFTVDYFNRTVTVTITDINFVQIHAFGFGGTTVIDETHFIGFSSNPIDLFEDSYSVNDVMVVQAGVQLTPSSQYTLSGNQLTITSPPSTGTDMAVVVFDGGISTATTMTTQILTYNSEQTWTLSPYDNETIPSHAGTIVEVNGLRLAPFPTFYGNFFPQNEWMYMSLSQNITTSTTLTIYIGNTLYTNAIPLCTQVSPTSVYPFNLVVPAGQTPPTNIPGQFVIFNGNILVALDFALESTVSIIVDFPDDQPDYTVSGATLTINVPLNNGDAITATTFSNASSMGIQTLVYDNIETSETITDTLLPYYSGGTVAFAVACSADGSVVVGEAENSSAFSFAVYWVSGVVHTLPLLNGSDLGAIASGISGNGTIIVGEDEDSSDINHAVKWTGGPSWVVTDLGFLPGGSGAYARGISNDGTVIVGQATNSSSINVAAYWDSFGIHALPLLASGLSAVANACSSNGSIIVGTATTSGNVSHAVTWTGGPSWVINDLGLLPSGLEAFGNGCNYEGTIIVGQAQASDSSLHAVYWNISGINELAYPLGGTIAEANGCNSDGTIIVGMSRNGSNESAVVWTNGVGQFLNQYPTTNIDVATACSSNGNIVVGIGQNGSNFAAIEWTISTVSASLLNSFLIPAPFAKDYCLINMAGYSIAPDFDYEIYPEEFGWDSFPWDTTTYDLGFESSVLNIFTPVEGNIVATIITSPAAREATSWRVVNSTFAIDRMPPILTPNEDWDVESWDSDVWDDSNSLLPVIEFVFDPGAYWDVENWDTTLWDQGGEYPLYNIRFDYIRQSPYMAGYLENPLQPIDTQIVINLFLEELSPKLQSPNPLPQPAPYNPGVIWVGNERIEYFHYSRTDDVVTVQGLRRGTHGTCIQEQRLVTSGTGTGSSQTYILDVSNGTGPIEVMINGIPSAAFSSSIVSENLEVVLTAPNDAFVTVAMSIGFTYLAGTAVFNGAEKLSAPVPIGPPVGDREIVPMNELITR